MTDEQQEAIQTDADTDTREQEAAAEADEKRGPRDYRVLAAGDSEESPSWTDLGFFQAHRAEDAITDAVEAEKVELDEEGNSPWLVAIPARSWAPRRLRKVVKTSITFSDE